MGCKLFPILDDFHWTILNMENEDNDSNAIWGAKSNDNMATLGILALFPPQKHWFSNNLQTKITFREIHISINRLWYPQWVQSRLWTVTLKEIRRVIWFYLLVPTTSWHNSILRYHLCLWLLPWGEREWSLTPICQGISFCFTLPRQLTELA